MKTIEITVYSFEELSDKAKAKALSQFCDINIDYDWWQFTYEDAERIGLKINGFDCEHGNIDLGLCVSVEYCCAKIIAEHGERCETYRLAKETLMSLQGIEEDAEDYECISREFLRGISECYISMLREEYEYLTSEEAIIETIAANDYTFLENGTQY